MREEERERERRRERGNHFLSPLKPETDTGSEIFLMSLSHSIGEKNILGLELDPASFSFVQTRRFAFNQDPIL